MARLTGEPCEAARRSMHTTKEPRHGGGAVGDRRGRCGGDGGRLAGTPAEEARRAGDHRVRAQPFRLVLRLRHPLLGGRRGRRPGRTDRPDAGGAPRPGHRSADAPRGHRTRPGTRPGAHPGAGQRRPGVMDRLRQAGAGDRRPPAPPRPPGDRRTRCARRADPRRRPGAAGLPGRLAGQAGGRRGCRLHRCGDGRGTDPPRLRGHRPGAERTAHVHPRPGHGRARP